MKYFLKNDHFLCFYNWILKINNLSATWVNLTTALKLTLPGDEIKFEIYGEDNHREVLVKTVASN